MKQAVLYIHGKGGSPEEADYYRGFCDDWEVFGLDYQTATPWETKEEILPAGVKARVSIEAGIAMPWYKYLGAYGKAISIEQFGLQGDGAQNMIDLGITAEHVVEAAKASLAEVNA